MEDPLRLVFVEWIDSYGCSSNWQDIEDINAPPLHCQSVGWLIHDGKDAKVIVPHLTVANHPNCPQQGCGDMTIPTASIRRMVAFSKGLYADRLEGESKDEYSGKNMVKGDPCLRT